MPAEASLIRLASDLDRSKSKPERFGEVRHGRPSPDHACRIGDIDLDQNASEPNRGSVIRFAGCHYSKSGNSSLGKSTRMVLGFPGSRVMKPRLSRVLTIS
jgi:hypothetical protein